MLFTARQGIARIFSSNVCRNKQNKLIAERQVPQSLKDKTQSFARLK